MPPDRPESTVGPVAPAERVPYLDLLRGFALLGVLVANFRGFGWPAEFYGSSPLPEPTAADRAAQTLVALFFNNKFITLLSGLFGVGFAIQLERVRGSGAGFLAVYTRRLGALLLFGLAHAFLLWWGDILVTYAAAGVLLLLFRRCGQRAVLLWSLTLLFSPLVYVAARVVTFQPAAAAAQAGPTPAVMLARASQAYLHGTWAELQRQLTHDWLVNNDGGYMTALQSLAWFLFGMFVWRSGLLSRLAEERSRLKRVFIGGVLGGTAGLVLVLVIRQTWQPRVSKLWGLLLATLALRIAASTALSLGYAAGMALLSLSTRCPALKGGMHAMGRMALSNYLLQSVAGTTLHYGYGFGLYGKVHALAALGISVVLYGMQLPLSIWWLGRFRFGPAEWLWRSLTYMKRQRMYVR
ncbi:MAG: DUF418 domain-containing protein [Acidobacteria bacterium]|nr:DUF418 domain-containing protein [Acidobacteriota bacterium]